MRKNVHHSLLFRILAFSMILLLSVTPVAAADAQRLHSAILGNCGHGGILYHEADSVRIQQTAQLGEDLCLHRRSPG